MLEGKELEGKIGDVGSYSLDVDDKGNIVIGVAVDKDFGFAKVQATADVSCNILNVAEAIAKKTATEWDDKAVEGLKKLLGV